MGVRLQIKGRYDEREAGTGADGEHLNEASRDLYFQELREEMRRISKAAEGEPELYIPSDKFKRGIGKYAGKNYTVEGTPSTVRKNIRRIWIPSFLLTRTRKP